MWRVRRGFGRSNRAIALARAGVERMRYFERKVWFETKKQRRSQRWVRIATLAADSFKGGSVPSWIVSDWASHRKARGNGPESHRSGRSSKG